MELIICNNVLKNKILTQIGQNDNLVNHKFMSMQELINHYYFTYTDETICYLMNKYGFKYSVSKIYLNNLYYVGDKKYDSDKLNFLVTLKQELDDKHLLIYDKYFKEYLKGTEITVYSKLLNKFELNMLEEIKKLTSVKVINNNYQEYSHVVYAFDTMEEEVDYVAYQISSLIEQGVCINDIKLTNINSDYYNTLKRIFNMYNLPINLNQEVIYGTKIANVFLENYTQDISKTIEKLKIFDNNKVIDIIIDICNKYSFTNDYNKVKELIIHDLKRTKLPNEKLENVIEIVDYKKDILDDKYVFMLGFNQETIPTIYRDEDYISDNIKDGLLLETTVERNKLEKELTIKIIKSIKNLTITYKLKTPFASFYPANLIQDLNYKVVNVKSNYLKSYSALYDKIKCGKMLDSLVKYGIKNDELDIFYHNYPIRYMSYDNSFKGIKQQDLFEYLENKLSLSYTSMNNYYKCAFKYYLSQILKLDIFEEKLATHIGSIFHYILEIGLDKDIDYNDQINKYIKKNNLEFDDKDYFFLNKLAKELPLIIETIRKQESYTLLKEKKYEMEISINKSNLLNTKFVGYIDKIMYHDNIYALIDYKTGNTDIDLTLVPYGINMQLPIYLYLAKSEYPDALFAGFYLQQILNGGFSYNDKESLLFQKQKALKLNGYSNSNKELLKSFDYTYEASSVIKSMRVKSDGEFYSYSKVLTNHQIDELINIVDRKIDECITNIEKGDFVINPKSIENKNIGCKYCKFQDICFMSNKDIVELKKYNDLSFLGGEDSAKLD